jgi:signal transduction histidine kinase
MKVSEPFRILLVEDVPEAALMTKDELEQIRPSEFFGVTQTAMEVVIARCQQEADVAITLGKFDLILLDLKYPLTAPDNSAPLNATETDSLEVNGFQGIEWLPTLRRHLPEAAIVILTAYTEGGLENAVRAIRDYQADEFLDKNLPWTSIRARLLTAWQRHSDRARADRLREEVWELLQSRALRTYGEDLVETINRMKFSFYRVATGIEGGDPSVMAEAPNRIRAHYDALQREVLAMNHRLTSGPERGLERAPVGQLVREVASLYEPLFWKEGAEVHVERLRPEDWFEEWGEGGNPLQPMDVDDVILQTYVGDLKVSLHEVFHNALDALKESPQPRGQRWLRIRIGQLRDGQIVIEGQDNGPGFSEDALKRMWEPEFSTRRSTTSDRGRHQGMGMYIARRMMTMLGGHMDAKNTPGDGALVVLRLRSLEDRTSA